MKYKEISLVMPVFNEQELLEETIKIFSRDLSYLVERYQIIIVNDGSTDKTGQIADKLVKTSEHIEVIHNPKNLGSGRSLLIGFKKARYDLVLTNFVDRPFDLKELGDIFPLFDDGRVDFVVVTRQDRSANSFYRKITSLVNYWLIKVLFNVKVGDFQFVQIYKKVILNDINIDATRTFVPPELIIKALIRGYRMKEFRTKFYPRTKGKSKCGRPRVILKTLHDLLRFWLKWKILALDVLR